PVARGHTQGQTECSIFWFGASGKRATPRRPLAQSRREQRLRSALLCSCPLPPTFLRRPLVVPVVELRSSEQPSNGWLSRESRPLQPTRTENHGWEIRLGIFLGGLECAATCAANDILNYT